MGQEDETTRKGPWTEHEDFQLVFYVHMFGDRRWDFIAKVSGLKRTGKSCRLRWVNYLNPGLKRGKLSPHEERLVLELHSKFGNRWSKIARKLPGRTDNEIKNYWRTHLRKIAQEKKRSTTSSSSSSLSQCSSSSSRCTTVASMPVIETKERSFYDTGGVDQKLTNMKGKNNNHFKSGTTRVSDSSDGYYWMDDIWNDLGLLEDDNMKPFFDPYSEIAPSLTWDSCLSTSWTMDGQEEFAENNFHLTSQHFSSELVD
ncbi:putative transcription factor MYB-HB-like family [Helianthus annuus]|uniref:Putative homeodomain-like protein n=1 Tax=Helianthus annuus TaxID=4232 RepID=A0A251UM75_HELAN|nr:transcription factor MYB59 [Helianthus annuus]KAF5804468.1 putative transcription factor MYB family [Helianthus annuus]KAJ0583378.1 putative transcription factor MYB-HB-like family [Helianthus annuus]KAJ0917519.1 putative transcription factor MYB-HB-like family [Helianthus annuus]